MTLADTVAFELHEAWRKPRLQPDGNYEPRWKKIKDEKFVENIAKNEEIPAYVRLNEAGEYEIDIANACYFQLSEDWKGENKAAAEVVAKMIESGKEYTDAEAGEIIHNAWLERNSWAKDGELGVPFDKLSKEEQEKDLVQYRIAKTMSEAIECDKIAGRVEDVYRILKQEKEAGKNTYMTNANDVMLYSMFDTEDTIYLKVTGKTKVQYEKAKAEWIRQYDIREEQARQKAKNNIETWYERGKQMIYPQKLNDWHKCVEGRANDLYNGADLVSALELMEALHQGKSLEEVSQMFDNANYSGAAASNVYKILVNFSDRGPEFFRHHVPEWRITPQTEEFLQKIENANALYSQNAAEIAKNSTLIK